MNAIVRSLTACALAATLASCTPEQPPPTATVDSEVVQAEATPQPADQVDLTVYFRQGRGADSFLTPVKRTVPVADAQPRQAIELLLRGPGRRDPRRLFPPLPPGTKLRAIDVRRGTATITLSHHAVSRAKQLGKRPEHEALALASVVNTLTEFPAVRRVRLYVQGKSKRNFWGFWGLPAVLVRDESVIDPQQAQLWPPLEGFNDKRQALGVKHRKRQPAVAAVRVEPRATYTRLTVEVTSADGSDLEGPVPPSEARRAGRGRLRLKVLGRPTKAVVGDIKNELRDPVFSAARVNVRGKPHRVIVTLRPRRRTEFWLHTLSEPARVVLDIRR